MPKIKFIPYLFHIKINLFYLDQLGLITERLNYRALKMDMKDYRDEKIVALNHIGVTTMGPK